MLRTLHQPRLLKRAFAQQYAPGRFVLQQGGVPSALQAARFRYGVGQNPGFAEIRGYLIAGEVNGPYGTLSPTTIEGLIVNRFQVNTSNNLVILALGPAGSPTAQIPGVNSVRVTILGVSLVLPWAGATNRYQANDAAFAPAVAEAINKAVDLAVELL